MRVIGDDDTVVTPALNAEEPQPVPRCIQPPRPPKKRRLKSVVSIFLCPRPYVYATLYLYTILIICPHYMYIIV